MYRDCSIWWEDTSKQLSFHRPPIDCNIIGVIATRLVDTVVNRLEYDDVKFRPNKCFHLDDRLHRCRADIKAIQQVIFRELVQLNSS